VDGEYLANEKSESQGALMAAWDIQEVEKGKRPTLLETQKANELIKAINTLGNITLNRTLSTNEVQYLADGIIISVSKVPDGFFEKEVEICEGGEVKTYVMLVRGPIE